MTSPPTTRRSRFIARWVHIPNGTRRTCQRAPLWAEGSLRPQIPAWHDAQIASLDAANASGRRTYAGTAIMAPSATSSRSDDARPCARPDAEPRGTGSVERTGGRCRFGT
jgi:hypothetical protein